MSASPQDLPRVLCVDDDAHVVEAIVLHLRKHYQVSTALSGHEGLTTLAGPRAGSVDYHRGLNRKPYLDGHEHRYIRTRTESALTES